MRFVLLDLITRKSERKNVFRFRGVSGMCEGELSVSWRILLGVEGSKEMTEGQGTTSH